MVIFFLFLFGVVIGSFLNVVSLRYDGEHFLLDPRMIGGRSHCPHCGKRFDGLNSSQSSAFLFSAVGAAIVKRGLVYSIRS